MRVDDDWCVEGNDSKKFREELAALSENTEKRIVQTREIEWYLYYPTKGIIVEATLDPVLDGYYGKAYKVGTFLYDALPLEPAMVIRIKGEDAFMPLGNLCTLDIQQTFGISSRLTTDINYQLTSLTKRAAEKIGKVSLIIRSDDEGNKKVVSIASTKYFVHDQIEVWNELLKKYPLLRLVKYQINHKTTTAYLAGTLAETGADIASALRVTLSDTRRSATSIVGGWRWKQVFCFPTEPMKNSIILDHGLTLSEAINRIVPGVNPDAEFFSEQVENINDDDVAQIHKLIAKEAGVSAAAALKHITADTPKETVNRYLSDLYRIGIAEYSANKAERKITQYIINKNKGEKT